MNRRQKIIVSVTGIFIVLLILVGLTYAYFLTQIRGNENDKSISVTTANLALVYSDGTDIVLTSEDKLIPGQFTKSKTFTVENTGNATVENYAVVLEDFKVMYAETVGENTAGEITNLDFPETMEMTLTCTNKDGSSCTGTSGSLPTTNDILVMNSIEEGNIQTYELTLTYVDNGQDQSSDMNKTIEGKLNIIDTQNTIDLTGTVASVSDGDYVQVNSEPKVSPINKDKTYKVVGLEPGTHTIGVYSSTGTLKGSSTFTLTKSTTESVSGTTINFTETSRTATININSDYTMSISSELESISKGELSTDETLLLNFNTSSTINNISTLALEDSEIKTSANAIPFSINNPTSDHKKITIKLTDIEMDEALNSIDFRWGLFNADTNKGISYGIFKDVENNEEIIYRDTIIDAGESKNYILRIWVHNNGTEQSAMQGKNFSAKVSVTGEVVEYTDESCFSRFDESTGTISASAPEFGYDIATCGTEVVIPKTINGVALTGLSGSVFLIESGSGLSSIIIPDTITNLSGEGFMFYNSTLSHITIPESITALNGTELPEVTSVTLPENIDLSSSGSLYDNKFSELIITGGDLSASGIGNSNLKYLVLMEGTSALGPGNFANSSQLTSVELPRTITGVYDGAFSGCTSLTEIIVRGKSSLEDFNYSTGLTTEGGLPEGVNIVFRD